MVQSGFKAWFLAAVVAALSLQSAFACQGKQVVFRDDFKTLDAAWGEDTNASVDGGKLLLRAPSGDGGFADHLLNGSNLFRDIDACVSVKFARAGDPVGASAGLVFWGESDSQYYMLVINPVGQYSIVRKVAAYRNLVSINWTPSTALRQGLNARNEIEVITRRNRAVFFINGVRVDHLEGDPPGRGSRIGVYWAVQPKRNILVEFSELRVVK